MHCCNEIFNKIFIITLWKRVLQKKSHGPKIALIFLFSIEKMSFFYIFIQSVYTPVMGMFRGGP